MRIRQYGGGSGDHVGLIGEWDPTSPAHEQLFRSTVRSAALSGRRVLIVTLDPAPASYIFGPMDRPPFDDATARLFAQERCGVQTRVKVELSPAEVEKSGVDHLLAELCARIKIAELVLGAKQTLGVGHLGDAVAVDEAARKRGITVRRLDPPSARPRTADARRLLATGYLKEVTKIVGHHLFWAQPADELVRLPWPPGWYKAVPYAAPLLGDRLPGEDMRIMVRRWDGSGCFSWPKESIPWLGFAAGPREISDSHG